ncbi:cbb3-type cytochrome oxidase assembly protein CcoS [Pseudomonas sp. TKO26]|uniref:Cytochrome oxidase maturation protein, cbb3-type n=2 Tax=Pseudomonas chlororaphis group TaxID=136842 RepID=A0A1H4RGK5_9PSED|nr:MULTISPECIES: cbb3-type cytochrome oxidase assembly protein CcoS [Pseudomonas]MCO7568436.1 cbb3-type cytochrome oxidase assembly protein CcoS [Pseudomonas chlororaphis]MCO7588279.1 cbb3-type cytochrome oxidase assembly protein CcoS [Pseudomonas chlororaphis]MCO7609308.1 cbb3-type cytochrome oxidase assembly protein CcoS [Pseudomonas chlororaphis]PUA46254.1 cbb3-type cytochrome oxidase assembly protein CcoS [Pseudomonas protegens]PYY87934.1 cbb3-type cytochrome oxidase assembly protein CcoS 
MPALYVMIPAALLIVAIAIYIFFWAVDSGQYDDLDGPAHSILFDDQDPSHTAAVDEAKGQPDAPTEATRKTEPPHA